MNEQQALRRAKQITYEMEALTAYIRRIAAERRSLVRDLKDKKGWSQHNIAAELGISQPVVHKILEKEAAAGASVRS